MATTTRYFHCLLHYYSQFSRCGDGKSNENPASDQKITVIIDKQTRYSSAKCSLRTEYLYGTLGRASSNTDTHRKGILLLN